LSRREKTLRLGLRGQKREAMCVVGEVVPLATPE
jgi:hypothetical protein